MKTTHFPGSTSDWSVALCGAFANPNHLDDENPNCPACLAAQHLLDVAACERTEKIMKEVFGA